MAVRGRRRCRGRARFRRAGDPATGRPALWPAGPESKTITVFVVSHGYHAGIALPRVVAREVAGVHGLSALDAVTERFAAYPWLEVGWGDEGFYRDVPTVASLNVGLALRALFRPGNPSVVHVVGVQGEPPAVFRHSDIVRLDLTEAGFVRLAAKVDATFFRPAGSKEPDALGPGLYGPSLFFRAVGEFHIFNVCNHWIADLLDAAGIPTVRLWRRSRPACCSISNGARAKAYCHVFHRSLGRALVRSGCVNGGIGARELR